MDVRKVARGQGHSQLDLLRVVGHELKTPLIHISGTAKLINSGSYSEEELPEQLARLDISSQHMLRLIDSLLLAGKIESDQLALDLEPVNVSAVVRTVADSLRPLSLRYSRHINVVQRGSLTPASLNREAFECALYGVLGTVMRSSKSEVVDVIMHHRNESVMLTIRDDGEKIPEKAIESAIGNLGKRSQLVKQLPGSAGLSLYVAQVVSEAQAGNFSVKYHKDKRVVSFSLLKSEQLALSL